MKTIKVEALTPEAVAPYGKIVSTEGMEDKGAPGSHSWFPQIVVRPDETSINLMEVLPREFKAQKFEAHDHTDETLLAMTGDVIVTCMPKDGFDIENLKAFRVPKGTGINFSAQTWHFVPYPVDESVWCACIFRNGTSTEDIYFQDLPEEVAIELD